MSSLPKQYNPVLSSSPSKQPSSLATTSNNPTTPQPIERHDHEPPSTTIITRQPEYNADDDEAAGDEHEHEEDDNPPAFRPFFTLIEDVHSSDYHHPTVHYIFSDDDPDLITEASLRALELSHDSPAQNVLGGSSGEGSETAQQRQSPTLEKPSYLPPPLPGVQERFIVLDVERTSSLSGGGTVEQVATSAGTGTTAASTPPTQKQPQPPHQQASSHGYRVASAHSLTPDWQVLDSSLSLAPTFDTPQNTNDPDTAAPSSALMLRIQGTAGFSTGRENDKEGKTQTLEEMMEQFDKRMFELRRVIEASGDCPLASRTQEDAGGDEPGKEEEGGPAGVEESAGPLGSDS
ncbi:hypothetical protein BGW36DRAFT_364812 [Talaromyces proteolyticus]|uniref:Anaphase promoting complex subunit 11 n=1 Tax=Talaromyces proteolyticus TaxID=1131652 RepID=A0AAD4PV12_9EURO|nr:uncharacterized protein BGW36DRAFT_364812 [Talaromyces proteolyticus]KAH8690086.1 hypothetical protein BGW36DRAFT_364812 [Talaromyces proteolyticus]